MACAAWRAARILFAAGPALAEPADVVDMVHACPHGPAIAIGAAGRYAYIADTADIATDTTLIPVLPDRRAGLSYVLPFTQPRVYVAVSVVLF